LQSDKSVREALKHERAAFDEQDRLTQEIFTPPPADPPSRAQADSTDRSLERIRSLREHAAYEKNTQRTLVMKRALGGVFIGSIEAASHHFSKKHYAPAPPNF